MFSGKTAPVLARELEPDTPKAIISYSENHASHVCEKKNKPDQSVNIKLITGERYIFRRRWRFERKLALVFRGER